MSAIIAAEAFFDLDAPVMRVTPPEIPPMPFSPLQEAEYMPSPEKIAAGCQTIDRDLIDGKDDDRDAACRRVGH